MRHRTILNLPTVNNIPYNVTTDGYLDTLVNQLNITIDEAYKEFNIYLNSKKKISNYTLDNNPTESNGVSNIKETIKPATDAYTKQQEQDYKTANESKQKDMGFFRKAWEKIKAFFAKIWGWIKGIFSNYEKKLDQLISNLKTVDMTSANSMAVTKQFLKDHLTAANGFNVILETDVNKITDPNSAAGMLAIAKLSGQCSKAVAKDTQVNIDRYENIVGMIVGPRANDGDKNKVMQEANESMSRTLLAAIDCNKDSNEYYKKVYAAISKYHKSLVTNHTDTTSSDMNATLKWIEFSKTLFKELKDTYNSNQIYSLLFQYITKPEHASKFNPAEAKGSQKANDMAFIVLDGLAALVPKKANNPGNNNTTEQKIIFNVACLMDYLEINNTMLVNTTAVTINSLKDANLDSEVCVLDLAKASENKEKAYTEAMTHAKS